MSSCNRAARPIILSLRQAQIQSQSIAASGPAAIRQFSSTAIRRDETTTTTTSTADSANASKAAPPPPPPAAEAKEKGGNASSDPDFARRKLDPNVTTLPWAERKLAKMGTPPIGSRRRRAAVRTSQSIPFEQLPYQCFQEARKILQADREEKIRQISVESAKIRALEAADASQFPDGEAYRQKKLAGHRNFVEELKILADINDPFVKRRFEDGDGDMSKPIYRYLARQRWEGQPRSIVEQRVSQFNIVPDVLPSFQPTIDVQLHFRGKLIPSGEILPAIVTEQVPRLRVQVFEKHERLVSVVVLDSDVPQPDTDSFGRRCHFLAANIPLSPVINSLPLSFLKIDTQLAVPWLPAFSQKGAPYHRMSIFILEQPAGAPPMDLAKLRELYAGRDGFSLKSYRDKFNLKPVGFTMFRTIWDESTAGVMERAGLEGADVEFKRMKVESLKGPRKARGWEAKRQGPKYRHLWKYTHRLDMGKGKKKFVR